MAVSKRRTPSLAKLPGWLPWGVAGGATVVAVLSLLWMLASPNRAAKRTLEEQVLLLRGKTMGQPKVKRYATPESTLEELRVVASHPEFSKLSKDDRGYIQRWIDELSDYLTFE